MKNRIKNFCVILTGVIVFSFSGCKHKQEPNKIIDSLPLNSAQTCFPAQMMQAWFTLNRDCVSIVCPVIERLGSTGATFGELTGPDSQSRYTFQTSGKYYGTAVFQITFKDSLGNTIDPITNGISTSTIKSVAITTLGSPSLFSFNESMALTIETGGLPSSKKTLTGTSNFSGNSYTLTFTAASPGITSTFDGLTEGTISVTGTGPNAPVSIVPSFYPDHTVNGSISWEDQIGGIHLEEEGSGTVITNTYRLILN